MPTRPKRRSDWSPDMFSLVNIWSKDLLRSSPSVASEWPDVDVPSLSGFEPLLIVGWRKIGSIFVLSSRDQLETLMSKRVVAEEGDGSGFIALHPDTRVKDLRVVRMNGEILLSRPYEGKGSIPLR